VNTIELWSEMDLFDLVNCVRLHQSLEEIVDFLCRPVSEVHYRIVELEQMGQPERWVAEAAAGAKYLC
jgi:hypothetical protein